MEELLIYIVKHLVDHPEDVTVKTVEKDDGIVLELRVNPTDMGKVIGRQGRIAKSIRTIIRSTSLRGSSSKVTVDIVD
jgi:uncharacterized protein